MPMASSRKILFVNHSSKTGGAETVLSAIVPLFKGSSAVFLFEDGPLRSIMQNAGIAVFMSKQRRSISGIKRDANLFRTALPLIGSLGTMVGEIIKAAQGYDIIYANSQKAFVLSALCTFITRKKLVWHLHDILTREHFSRAQIKLAIGLANAKASQVIVPSSATGRAFVEAGGRPNLVKVVHNGVNFPEGVCGVKYDEERRLLGLPSGFTYGVFSRLSPWKGQHVAIEALTHLPAAKCVIVGDAQFGEAGYANDLKDLAVALGVSDRVAFLGHRTNVPQLMKSVDVYCHPSTSPEPFSLAVLEAMHAGLPIVASNGGGIPEAIKDGISGYLADPGSASDLAKYIAILQSDPATAKRLGSNAHRDVIEKFSISKMQSTLLAVIEELY